MSNEDSEGLKIIKAMPLTDAEKGLAAQMALELFDYAQKKIFELPPDLNPLVVTAAFASVTAQVNHILEDLRKRGKRP